MTYCSKIIATLRSPGLKVKLLVGNIVKSHDQLKGAVREYGKSLRCAKVHVDELRQQYMESIQLSPEFP